MAEDPRFLNPHGEIMMQKNRLPHWEQDGCSYFLTFRLADSVPKHLLDDWKSERLIWLQLNPEPWSQDKEKEYHERFSGARERWLDAQHGECLLQNRDARSRLDWILKEDAAQIWAYVTMPNHVHVLASLPPETELANWMQVLKGGSAYAINQALGRRGQLWAKDYFDRLIRDRRHFRNCAHYIRKNPVKAHLSEGAYTLFESEYVRELLA